MSNVNQDVQGKLEEGIKKILPKDSSVRCLKGAGGWTIEAVVPDLKATERSNVFKNIEAETKNLSTDDWVIWKIFLYSNGYSRFTESGILKTTSEPSTSGGRRVLPLIAADCIIWITEFDSENLKIGDEKPDRVFAIEAKNDKDFKIMPFNPSQEYFYLETGGMTFGLSDKHPKKENDIIEIQL